MSGELKPHEATGPLALTAFLRRVGDPNTLDQAADALEGFPAEREQDAARTLRDLATSARMMLEELEAEGVVYDSRSGTSKVRTPRRGPNVSLSTFGVVAAFNALGLRASQEWTPETFDRIRGYLADFLLPEDLAGLTDGAIRSRLMDWSHLLRR